MTQPFSTTQHKPAAKSDTPRPWQTLAGRPATSSTSFGTGTPLHHVSPSGLDGASEPASTDDEGFNLLPRRVRASEIVYMTNQLAIMVDTGVTLSSALTSIIEQEQNPTLKKVLVQIRTSVEEGDDFSTALSKHPRYFDNTFVTLVRVSEATGTLGPMLERVAIYLRRRLETRGKVRAAMAYPAVMFVLAVGVTIFLLTYVMPKFMPIFSSRGIDLPLPTKVLMAVSSAVTDYWYAYLGGAIAAIVGFVLFKRTPPGRELWDGFVIRLPVLGPALRKVVLSRCVRTLGIMVHGGVSLLEALKLTAEVAGNRLYERMWLHVHEQVTSGNEIYSALKNHPLMPGTLVQMIRAGEESGQLETVLARVSDYYDQEVETSLKAATSLIEPIMIAGMGAVIGSIGLALLLPVFKLSRSPGGH